MDLEWKLHRYARSIQGNSIPSLESLPTNIQASVFFGPVSNVYISSANNEEIKFSIHNAALRKSVVFAEELEEGKDLEIEQFGSAKVPASQNQLYFSKVVTCLYTNTFCDDGVERTPRELATAYTRLYLIGCSYDIPCLMQAALRKLRSIRDYLKQDPLILLEIAELAYSTRVMKSGFRTFFVTNANCVVDSDDRAVKDYVRRLVVRGGDLASSIFEAQHNWREELLSNHEGNYGYLNLIMTLTNNFFVDLRESLRSHPVNVPGAFSEASQATWEQ